MTSRRSPGIPAASTPPGAGDRGELRSLCFDLRSEISDLRSRTSHDPLADHCPAETEPDGLPLMLVPSGSGRAATRNPRAWRSSRSLR